MRRRSVVGVKAEVALMGLEESMSRAEVEGEDDDVLVC